MVFVLTQTRAAISASANSSARWRNTGVGAPGLGGRDVNRNRLARLLRDLLVSHADQEGPRI